ncbi:MULTISPECIES: ribose-phosphate diphosphokinase [Fusobacterium]|uniref:ribose-phosphate diphosphokinase n=1 Tax=Fusobacterium TaxID=848 RepID=UPI001F4F7F8F|nr:MULTISPECIES: ribose-phosphate diphosphokinase [Fusobacterium]MDD7392042.1 ribose-phosphate diphosphokinase [Fusobacteriaceae bacterium]MCI5724786.1 ribose-phosphate diphosphokinase [Fusobacterium sp.]MCI7223986.1 ribose-phosphate diphosphokinase [Fusobacterium sp.]MDD7410229.1 ribose-phosphate diphosphokinase [Fusobacteriaceae bacterium]MDY5306493.1 ribose-phosphate diphosphokinase [Fusobacterium gastrosuis]
MNSCFSNVKIFAGNSNLELAKRVAEKCGLELGKSEILRFKDGEIYIEIEETVRGRDVFVVQSTSEPVNENIMELLIFVDALKRASAKTINVIIPYYGYARQDRKSKPREPITSKLVANLLTTAGVNRVVTMDLHADQIQGFFDIPVDHMQALPLMANYFKERGFCGDKVVVVSPDIGGVKRARKLAEKLDCKIAIIDKRRPKPNMSEVMNLIGEVEGKIAIFIDDMIDTAGTITNGADAILERGAVEAYACCSHAVFSDPAVERLEKSGLKEVIVTDSICLPERKRIGKVKIISVDTIFANAIERIISNKSVSELFG